MAERVLVPMDGSPRSWEALRYALSTYPEASIHALHVNDPEEWIYSDEMGGFFSEDAYEGAKASARELLEEAQGVAGEEGIELTTATATGKPARSIVEYVGDHDIDHVVMGSHGRKGVSRILLGSVAETVVRRSPVPVTVIRSPEGSA